MYATREKYKANMIINLYSYGPPNEFRISKGIFTKNTVVYPHSVKLLTETFTLDRMRKYFLRELRDSEQKSDTTNAVSVQKEIRTFHREEHFSKRLQSRETIETIRPIRRSTVIDARRLSVGTDQTACSLPRPINEAFSLSWNGYSC